MQDQDEIPQGVKLTDPEDFTSIRKSIFDGVKDEITKAYPHVYGGVRIHMDDVDYEGPEDFDIDEQKEYLLKDKYLSRRLRGTMRLFDDNTGDLLDEKKVTLMRVPYLTERGTFIHNGNEYTTKMQSRLLPGVYSRKQENGELEAQFNVRPGGTNFRVGVNPEDMQYRLRVQQSNLHLYSLLKDIGVEDKDLEGSWGSQILDVNRKKYDARTLDKAFERMIPARIKRTKETWNREDKIAAIKEAFETSQVDKRILSANLPNLYDRSKAASWNEEWETVKSASMDMVKEANFTMDELKWLASYLNTNMGAGISITGTAEQIENAILAFIGMEADVNPHVLAASQLPVLKQAAAPRIGAGAILPTTNGKYLMERNHGDAEIEADRVGKLRPVGGGMQARDKCLRDTMIRELKEELGLSEDFIDERLEFLGYITRGEYAGCGMFEMRNHGLKPGKYQASNSSNEWVDLVEASLSDPDYVGWQKKSLRKPDKWDVNNYKRFGKFPAWIGVDLDGTLAVSQKGKFDLNTIGDPVPAMIRKVRTWMDAGWTVKVFTARAAQRGAIGVVKQWLKDHGLGNLDVTNIKDPGMVLLYDDKAVEVGLDTGRSKWRA